MKPDQFLLASNLVEPVQIDHTAASFLDDFALMFLRGGGTITLTEYAGLNPASRLALATAGEVLEDERAEKHAAAILRGAEELALAMQKAAAESAIDALADSVEKKESP